MRLSDHFELAEFEATGCGLPNAAPPAQALRLRDLCLNVLEPLRSRLGPVKINSGYRSSAVNRAVGGAPTSQHLAGEAADIEIPGHSNLEVAAWIRDHLPFDQLILEGHRDGDPASGWVHVSWTGARRPRHSVLTMRLGPHGPVYAAGLPAALAPILSQPENTELAQ